MQISSGVGEDACNHLLKLMLSSLWTWKRHGEKMLVLRWGLLRGWLTVQVGMRARGVGQVEREPWGGIEELV